MWTENTKLDYRTSVWTEYNKLDYRTSVWLEYNKFDDSTSVWTEYDELGSSHSAETEYYQLILMTILPLSWRTIVSDMKQWLCGYFDIHSIIEKKSSFKHNNIWHIYVNLIKIRFHKWLLFAFVDVWDFIATAKKGDK